MQMIDAENNRLDVWKPYAVRRSMFPLQFENLLSLFRNEKKTGKCHKKTTYPYGPESDEIIRYEYELSGFKYDTDYFFHTKREDRPCAIREKFYLHADFFKNKSLSSDFNELCTWFESLQRKADQHEISKVINNSEAFSDHLMLIKYSISNKEEQEDQQFEVHSIGSKSFGVGHDDETLFSYHLGESYEEFHEWNYDSNCWERGHFSDYKPKIIYGELSRSFGYTPTFHCLVPNIRYAGEDRYCVIFERTLWDLSEFKFNTMSKNFARFDLSKFRDENHVAFFLYPYHTTNYLDKGLVKKLTEDYLRVHLFFYNSALRFDLKEYSYEQGFFDHLEKNGISKVLLVPDGALIYREALFDLLLSASEYENEKFWVHIDDDQLRGIRLFNIKEGQGKILDDAIARQGFHEACRCLPNKMLVVDRPEDYAYYIKHDCENLSQHIKCFRAKLNDHLKEGFKSSFVFNTESYGDIDRCHKLDDVSVVIGLASGFKLNYLISKIKKPLDSIHYVDLNEQTLGIKKKMIKTWRGTDFLHWYNKKILKRSFFQKPYVIYESTYEHASLCWERELSLWGGDRQFKLYWDHFTKQKIHFNHIDLINNLDKLLSLIPKDKKVALWISNVWHNEFIHYYFADELLSRYKNWVVSIYNHNSNVLLFQSEIAFKGKVIKFSSVEIEKVYNQLKDI